MINCPVCSAKIELNDQNAVCSNKHVFSRKNNVYQIIRPEFKKRIEKFLEAFEDWRKPYIKEIEAQHLKDLPYKAVNLKEWKGKQSDIEIIKKFKTRGKALDVGAWNGWLSNILSEIGFNVTAVDIFTHEKDGLGANIHYDNKWLNIQTDLSNLSLLTGNYDLIVINRSISYFEDIEKTIPVLKSLLNKNGVLLISGINYVRNPKNIIRNLKKTENYFHIKYKVPLFLYKTKGYLDKNDIKNLKELGIKLYIYKKMKVKSFFAYLLNKRPFFYYGLYKK